MIHPMKTACVGYISIHPENQMPPQVGQDDLLRALEVELGHINPIRISLIMQWNMEVQYTSNYFLAMDLQEYIGIRSC